MKSLNDFINYLEQEVAFGSVYVLGAQGQRYPFADKWLMTREHDSQSNVNRIKKTLEKRIADGYDPNNIGAFDCSGLGMYYLIKEGYLSSDLNANGMRGQCEVIDKANLKRGDWVFVMDGGRATHIGYVVNDNLDVIEARGRDYGVVKTKLAERNWNHYGRPKMFKADIEAPKTIKQELKKGDKGDEVKAVQLALIANGYSLPKYGADSSFGGETYNAVCKLQKALGVAQNGIVGKTEIEALGLVWGGVVDYEKLYNELMVNYETVTANCNALTEENGQLKEAIKNIKNISEKWC